jgi:hypothetical protein
MRERHHLEVWFGVNPNQLPRPSGWRGHIRFEGVSGLWEGRFDFSGGSARPGQMVYTRVWFRAPDDALPHARPTVRFDVLDGLTVIATGEVVSR